MDILQDQPWLIATILTVALGALRFLWTERETYSPFLSQYIITSFHIESDNKRFQPYLSWFHERFKTSSNLKAGHDTLMAPNTGFYKTRFEGAHLLIQYGEKERKNEEHKTFLTFHFLGRKQHLLDNLLGEAKKAHARLTGDSTEVWTNLWGYWELISKRAKRPSESLFFHEDLHQDLLEDIQQFLRQEESYANKGLPWQRGYLLYGPPGNGKSSLILWLASQLGYGVGLLNLARLNDGQFIEIMRHAPEDTFIVFEDTDFLMRSSKEKEARPEDPKGPRLSTVLNVLDGAIGSPGRLLFITTNHRETLIPALIRTGRADIHIEIAPPTSETIRQMFCFYYPETDPKAFTQKAIELHPSMSDLQVHFNRFSADEALRQIGKLIQSPDPDPEPPRDNDGSSDLTEEDVELLLY